MITRLSAVLPAAFVVFLSTVLPSNAAEPAIPHFVEETSTSGVDHIYAGEWEYMAGGGVAAFDCNKDGFPDMMLAGGAEPAKFYRNASSTGGPLEFVAEISGLEIDKVTGAYPIDVDSDGVMDVVLLRVGENLVMRGTGGCRFERANELWGFDGGDAWSTAFAATFERGASWPTMAIGNYIDRTQDVFPWGSCTDNWLHRPAATGPRFAPPVALEPSFCALSMLFTDWNRSGTPALRVSNDREYYKGGQEQLWRVEPGKPASLYTAEEGWKFLRIWGMGIASYDLNGDRFPEYFLTSMADNKLQTLAAPDEHPRPDYKDVAYAKGVTAPTPYFGEEHKPSTAWHADFQDVNNDGLVDLFIAKGNVARMPDFAAQDPNNLLLQQSDGKFQEAGEQAGVASTAISRGAALADFNLDGWIDIVVVNRWVKAQVWRNTGANAGRWIEIRLDEPGVNRSALGAWIEVRCDGKVQRREITSGGGHAGGSSGWWHFGVGNSSKVSLRVIWPDGTVGPWQDADANAFYMASRDRPLERWSAKAH